MNVSAGTFIKSTSLLDSSEFEEARIFITEHNARGTTGFVVNKLFPRLLNELEEFKKSPGFPLYEGGPVDKEHLFFIHKRPDLIKGGTTVANGIFLGGDFKEALDCINNKAIGGGDIKIFVGYCGWDYAQLEEEVEEGSWVIADDPGQNPF